MQIRANLFTRIFLSQVSNLPYKMISCIARVAKKCCRERAKNAANLTTNVNQFLVLYNKFRWQFKAWNLLQGFIFIFKEKLDCSQKTSQI